MPPWAWMTAPDTMSFIWKAESKRESLLFFLFKTLLLGSPILRSVNSWEPKVDCWIQEITTSLNEVQYMHLGFWKRGANRTSVNMHWAGFNIPMNGVLLTRHRERLTCYLVSFLQCRPYTLLKTYNMRWLEIWKREGYDVETYSEGGKPHCLFLWWELLKRSSSWTNMSSVQKLLV